MNRRIKGLNRSCCSNGKLLLTYVILAYTISSAKCSRPPPCGLYGAPPCPYLPAPPGQTPSCARPGKTYCEHVDNYPTYLIKHLVQKWGYEARNLLVDETWEDFAAVAWHETPVFYDPKSIFPQRDLSNPHGNDFNGYSYYTPPFGAGDSRGSSSSISSSSRSAGHSGNSLTSNSLFISKPLQTTEAPTYLLYTSAGQRLTTPYNATVWLKRLARDLGQTRDHELDGDHKKSRSKRQSPGRTSLCQTTSQFITPQAALNSRGNWMFVVNEANTARQMVKAELCASNTCSNLCELPNGYNSRCEQKFVQKRLIALQGNGQNLYTDTFWFPSCCVCTIAAN